VRGRRRLPCASTIVRPRLGRQHVEPPEQLPEPAERVSRPRQITSRFLVLMAGDYSGLYCEVQHHQNWASRTADSHHRFVNVHALAPLKQPQFPVVIGAIKAHLPTSNIRPKSRSTKLYAF
jgi:hypothetical protein